MGMVRQHAAPSESVKLGSYTLPLPRSRILRIVIGVLLIIGGFFAILPIFGFWMVPLGLLVLSIDIPRVRRWRRRFAVWFSRRYPRLAAKLHVQLSGERQRQWRGQRRRRLKPLASPVAFSIIGSALVPRRRGNAPGDEMGMRCGRTQAGLPMPQLPPQL